MDIQDIVYTKDKEPLLHKEPLIHNTGNTLIVMWGIRRSGNHCIRDWIEYQWQAQKMKVFQRWEYYKDYKPYKELFTDEIRHYSRKLFDFEPF